MFKRNSDYPEDIRSLSGLDFLDTLPEVKWLSYGISDFKIVDGQHVCLMTTNDMTPQKQVDLQNFLRLSLGVRNLSSSFSHDPAKGEFMVIGGDRLLWSSEDIGKIHLIDPLRALEQNKDRITPKLYEQKLEAIIRKSTYHALANTGIQNVSLPLQCPHGEINALSLKGDGENNPLFDRASSILDKAIKTTGLEFTNKSDAIIAKTIARCIMEFQHFIENDTAHEKADPDIFLSALKHLDEIEWFDPALVEKGVLLKETACDLAKAELLTERKKHRNPPKRSTKLKITYNY